MRSPKIVVCIAVRNQRDYIEECVGSVLAQEVDADVQIIIGDDQSEDGTSDWLCQLATRHRRVVSVVRRESRIGGFANMRDLISRADGDFIARLDGDDYWLPRKLARQASYLVANTGCAAVFTNALVISPEGATIGLFNDMGNAKFGLADLVRGGNFLNNSSVLFRPEGRGAWLMAEGLQVDFHAHLWHARNGWMAQIAEPLTVYRLGYGESMLAKDNDRVRELYWHAIESVPRDFISDSDLAWGQADFLRRVAFRALRTRDAALVRQWAPRVLAASPFGKLRTGAMVFDSIMRAATREVAGWASHHLRGTPRVLYRR